MNIKLPDEWVRRINAMLRWFEGGTGGGSSFGGTAGSIGLLPSSSKVVQIKNTTSATVEAGGVLGISTSLVVPVASGTGANLSHFFNRIILSGTTPTISSHFTSFAIVQQPIVAGGIGAAVVGDTCAAKLNIVNANHQWANVTDNSTVSLKSAGSGMARILYKESGTGVKYAIVQLDLTKHLIPVALTQTGGSAGTSSAQCSFTYTAKTLDGGDTIATVVGHIGNRPIKAEMTAATKGVIGRDASGNWKIVDCDEQMNNDPC